MREQNSIANEYPESWDDGTYQTGPSKPQKGQSVMITVLLMMVIFLGGIASALGIMNIRLLTRVMEQNENTPLSLESTEGVGANVFFRHDEKIARLPERVSLKLNFASVSQEQPLTRQQILEQSAACTVMLTVQTDEGVNVEGYGLIVSSDGYLVTNAALADRGDNITATFADGQQQEVFLVASDVYSDLALLYVQGEDLSAAQFAQILSPGEQVYASRGQILSSGDLYADVLTGFFQTNLIRTDLQMSSGPVFNDHGQVVGLLCSYLGEGQNGLLLPGRQMENILSQLAQNGAVSGRPRLGFRAKVLNTLCRQYWNLSAGLQVTSITDPQSSLAQGLQEGDILMSIDGRDLDSLPQLYGIIGEAEEGQCLAVQVLRAGQKIDLELIVEHNP